MYDSFHREKCCTHCVRMHGWVCEAPCPPGSRSWSCNYWSHLEVFDPRNLKYKCGLLYRWKLQVSWKYVDRCTDKQKELSHIHVCDLCLLTVLYISMAFYQNEVMDVTQADKPNRYFNYYVFLFEHKSFYQKLNKYSNMQTNWQIHKAVLLAMHLKLENFHTLKTNDHLPIKRKV